MFTRRYSSLPSAADLLKVSGVVIVDAPPPRPAQAAVFGKICLVGEFEDGPFDTPTDLLTSSDQASIFGLFGHQYGSSKYVYPCAQKSGGSEAWNGNGWVQTAKLKFGALTFCRVDTSVGAIALTPRAFLQSSLKAPFSLDDGLTFIFNPNGSGNVTVTFSAVAASLTTSGGTFTGFVGGEALTLAIDGGASFPVVFQASDITLSAIIARINLAYGRTIASNAAGQLKITSPTKGTASHVVVTASAVATTLGFGSLTNDGSGDFADASQATFAEVEAKVEAASAAVELTLSADGFPRLVSKTGGSGTIAIGGGSANEELGFIASSSAAATTSRAVSVPAGTRANDGGAGATRVITMQSTVIAKGSAATTLLRVRPAVDDGAFAGVAAGGIDTLEDKPGDLEWAVSNPLAIGGALSASELDSLYLAAIDATQGVGSDVTKTINGIVSARQSNAIRARLKQNAVEASANGHYGRRAFLSPPNGTSAASAVGSAAPGVGAYRAEEVAYAAGGVMCFLQEMVDGGYSSDGLIVRHPDALLASRWSVLEPGYNPGQLPEDPQYRFDATTFPGLEPTAASWDIGTYASFKSAGVCGGEFDKDAGLVFEQGVTAVDPAIDPARVDISRKTLADFIGDSLTGIAKFQAKRQGTERRREQMRASMEGFLDTLLGDTVESYEVTLADPRSQNKHVVRWDIAVNPVESSDVIVFNLSVGPNAVELSRG